MNRKGSDEALIAAAAAGQAHARVARASGVSISTVKRRLGEPEIVEAIRDLRLQQHRAYAAQMGDATGDAIERLRTLVDHEDPHVALRAIALVLGTWPKLTAVADIEERLNSLEAPRPAPADDGKPQDEQEAEDA